MAEHDCAESDAAAPQPPTGLSPRQEAAITSLLVEPTIDRAAKAAGVGDRTLHLWLRQPAFAAEYYRCRREAFGQAMGTLQRYASAAVSTLVKIIADGNVPAATKVSASTAILKFAREGIELEDLSQRLEKLEEMASRTPDYAKAGMA